MAARTYSKLGAQVRTIESLFAIMLQENPTAAQVLLVKLQRQLGARSHRGANAG